MNSKYYADNRNDNNDGHDVVHNNIDNNNGHERINDSNANVMSTMHDKTGMLEQRQNNIETDKGQTDQVKQDHNDASVRSGSGTVDGQNEDNGQNGADSGQNEAADAAAFEEEKKRLEAANTDNHDRQTDTSADSAKKPAQGEVVIDAGERGDQGKNDEKEDGKGGSQQGDSTDREDKKPEGVQKDANEPEQENKDNREGNSAEHAAEGEPSGQNKEASAREHDSARENPDSSSESNSPSGETENRELQRANAEQGKNEGHSDESQAHDDAVGNKDEAKISEGEKSGHGELGEEQLLRGEKNAVPVAVAGEEHAEAQALDQQGAEQVRR